MGADRHLARPDDVNGSGDPSGPSLGVRCHGLTHAFSQGRRGRLDVLSDLTFRIDPGEFVCLVGPSGCGKTTLLRILAGLVEPRGGHVVFEGPVPPDGRPRSSLVFQDHAAFPWMPVVDNVAFGLEMEGMPRRRRLDVARAYLDRVGLASFADHYPHQLSVGMRQRVGIGRAFVASSPLLLMDEPFGSLDAQTKRVLQRELLRVWHEHRKTVVFVTHDVEEAVLLGDRVLVLTRRPGRVREEIRVPWKRPRDLSLGQEEVRDVVRRVWGLIEAEVEAAAEVRP